MRTLTPLEIAVGYTLGRSPAASLPAPGPGDPLAQLEAATLPGLRRGPCLVSFSGGRDSSTVLAAATRAARRHGLPDPVPATIRAPAAPRADESAWQERVVRHLGLQDWIRLEFTDELDAVGPIAQRGLRRHGLLWPFNAHFHVPLFAAARGGSVLTGVGGDELFAAATSPRAAAVLTGRVRPVARDARRIALYAAPRTLRRWWHARADLPLPWLTPVGRAAAIAAVAELEADQPRRLTARLAWLRGATPLAHGTASLGVLADDAGVAVTHPLLDRALWSAVARAAPRGGYLGRAAAMRSLFGDLLPAAVLERSDKASFDELFFTHHSRQLAAGWNGDGAPQGLVDVAAVRAHWRGDHPHAHSFTLLQAAFLASAADRVDEPPAGLGQGIPAARAAQTPDGQ